MPDLAGIRGTVVVNHEILMIAGFIVGLLFLINIPFLYQRRRFGIILLFLLAACRKSHQDTDIRG